MFDWLLLEVAKPYPHTERENVRLSTDPLQCPAAQSSTQEWEIRDGYLAVTPVVYTLVH